MTTRSSALLLGAAAIVIGCATSGSGETTPISGANGVPGNPNGPPSNPNGPNNSSVTPCTGTTSAAELLDILVDTFCAKAASCGTLGGGGGGGGGQGGDGGFAGDPPAQGGQFAGKWSPGSNGPQNLGVILNKLLIASGGKPIALTRADGQFGMAEFCALASGIVEECKASPASCEFDGPESIPVCASSVRSCMQAIINMIPCDLSNIEDFSPDPVPAACAGLGAFESSSSSGGSGGMGGGDGGAGFGGGGTGGFGGTSGTDCYTTCANKQIECTTTIDCAGFCGGASPDVTCLSGISCPLIYTCGATVIGSGGTGGVGGVGGFGGTSGGCTTAPDCSGCVSGSCQECLCYYDTTTCASLCG